MDLFVLFEIYNSSQSTKKWSVSQLKNKILRTISVICNTCMYFVTVSCLCKNFDLNISRIGKNVLMLFKLIYFQLIISIVELNYCMLKTSVGFNELI